VRCARLHPKLSDRSNSRSDRWRLIETLGVVKERWFDPYNQNTYKGDRPICVRSEEEDERRAREGRPKCRTPKIFKLKGDEWFFAVSAISDTLLEPRTFPIPVGVQTTTRPGSIDVFGKNDSLVAAQTFILGAALIKGSTAYKPPDVEYRVTLALNANYVDVSERRVLFVEPSKGTDRFDYFLGVQELFVDYHIRNVSDRFDFDSIRAGIQPFQFDFRGFLFNDQQLGVRLFGNRDNNRFQYNLAAIWRLEKDTNSGLNSIGEFPRDDFILHANVFRQDFPVVGLTSTASLTYNMNREKGEIEVDDNGFPVRPALIGNLRPAITTSSMSATASTAAWAAQPQRPGLWRVRLGPRQHLHRPTGKIRSYFFAAEPSYDVDFFRFAAHCSSPAATANRSTTSKAASTPSSRTRSSPEPTRATGSGRPSRSRAAGVPCRSTAQRHPEFARSSKEEGQSNFNNPGTILVGAGVDADVTPEVRISANANHLWFHKTAVLEALRTEGSIPKVDRVRFVGGCDLPSRSSRRNLVFRASAAVLQPGKGFKDLFDNNDRDKRYYSVLLNAILTY
jgi:hypothetical protein